MIGENKMKYKNVNAINKIIGELSYRDYKAQWARLTDNQKNNVRNGKRKFSYTLSEATMQAVEIKKDYLEGRITESDYKSYCLQYNVRTARE